MKLLGGRRRPLTWAHIQDRERGRDLLLIRCYYRTNTYSSHDRGQFRTWNHDLERKYRNGITRKWYGQTEMTNGYIIGERGRKNKEGQVREQREQDKSMEDHRGWRVHRASIGN